MYKKEVLQCWFFAAGVMLILLLQNAEAAEFDVTLTATIAGKSSDLYIQTNTNAQATYDGYDFEVPTAPSNYTQLYTSVSGKSLSVDTWSATNLPRTINLTFGSSPSVSGNLNLSWNTPGSEYVVTLNDYGTDNTRSTSVTSFDLTSRSSYNVSTSGTRYFAISVSTPASPAAPSAAKSSGGAGGAAVPIELQPRELIVPITNVLEPDDKISFIFERITHTVTILNMTKEQVEIIVQSEPQKVTLSLGEERQFDVNNDGKTDIAIKVNSIDFAKKRVSISVTPLGSSMRIIAEPEELVVSVVANEETTREINLANKGNKPIDIFIGVEQIGDIVQTESNVSLKPGEEKKIVLKITGKGKGISAGAIVFLYGGARAVEIPITVNIKSENFLFDTSVTIPAAFRKVPLGTSTISAQVTLQEIKSTEQVDVTVRYLIKDFSGTTYIEESETFSVLREKSYIKEFNIGDLPAGKYFVGIEIEYPGAFATSSTQFEVVVEKKPEFSPSVVIWYIIGIIAVFTVIIIIVLIWAASHRKRALAVQTEKSSLKFSKRRKK